VAQNLDDRMVRAIKTDHSLFDRPLKVSAGNLIKSLSGLYRSYPAVVFPGDNLIAAEGPMTLLSVSSVGRGRLIYCGLPLAAMFRDLHPETVDFFINLIEYSRR
jgi:hypothetical protein